MEGYGAAVAVSSSATAGALEELERRRSEECRLTPDRALSDIEEAGEFLLERGLLTRSPDSALPSLYGACHEDPYLPGGHGFAAWPRTKYSWAAELAERPDVIVLKIHNGKSLFLGPPALTLADPVCRAELARMTRADREWRRLLDFLADAGPSLIGDVRQALGLRPPELKALRAPLERCGALVSRQRVLPTSASEPSEPSHVHTSEIARFDQIAPLAEERDPGVALEELTLAAVRAAVVAPEREVGKWFSWRWLAGPDLAQRLVDQGRLTRPSPGWVCLPPTSAG